MAELVRKYVVMTMTTAAPFQPADHDAVFVLKPWKDPAALVALAAYRDSCYPELAQELDAWIKLIEAGPVVRGDVGRRNEAHVKRGRRASAEAPRRTAPHVRPAASHRAKASPRRRLGKRRGK